MRHIDTFIMVLRKNKEVGKNESLLHQHKLGQKDS